MTKILIVEDEAPIREVIRFVLETADFQTLEAGHAEAARKLILTEEPDLVLLDLMLPGRSGLELAEQLRRDSKTRKLPIIMLTAKVEDQDKVAGLQVGADDYITKPFSPQELLLRIKAILRRTIPLDQEPLIEVEGLCLDSSSHRVSVNDKTITLAPTEYRLLHFLMSHPERAFDRSRLLDSVWGSEVFVEERTVDVHIRRLRKLLEPTGHQHLIQTIHGVGYRFSKKT